ncbi:hypothetical protein M6B22_02950 [Jatrophihabitans cynanchi]|jgi:hypothetical protein|uniref:Tail assembly chaperone E/41/14-like protein n=1 Tax=Jatrophihabitans cynanchi TaxID=2944128 RepID=A0ABY7K357_9ACTN|nr:hypothetical protein [Jatrophihabitans sp. SB3-54]WAX57736.1 hypothetical protein M6B22_02950 [Jatrophihabitans sp. SB3-54]
MSALKTSYEFTLPRGYVDGQGRVHRTGTMRLATARDELDPLRDPTVTGPDDPRLTILVLTRVVDRLGDLELVTSHDIEGLFAVDLAFLQDFYGVINFGSKEEYDELIRSQQQTSLLGDTDPAPQPDAAPSAPSAQTQEDPGTDPARPALRTAVEEFSRQTP